jgi:hypothetical protein
VKTFVEEQNPPVMPFSPKEPEGSSKRKLKPAHQYALAWMNGRAAYGGGIIGDQMGMGKVNSSCPELTLDGTEFDIDRMSKENFGSQNPNYVNCHVCPFETV